MRISMRAFWILIGEYFRNWTKHVVSAILQRCIYVIITSFKVDELLDIYWGLYLINVYAAQEIKQILYEILK